MKRYTINKKSIERWKADVQKSVLFYNDWFLNFAPTTYINARQEALNKLFRRRSASTDCQLIR